MVSGGTAVGASRPAGAIDDDMQRGWGLTVKACRASEATHGTAGARCGAGTVDE